MKNDLETLRRIADAAAAYLALEEDEPSDYGRDGFDEDYDEWDGRLCKARDELMQALEAREAT